MSKSRPFRSLVVAAGICALAGAGPGGLLRGQQTPDQQPQGQQPQGQQLGQQPAPPDQQPAPIFRTDANYVLTDVFVTADGRPVTDLTQADFELREDGVVQAIRSFEAVRHASQPVAVERREPSSVAESNAMAADPRRRLFVVFLDTYHVERAGSMVVREALRTFLKTALGPEDLVAFMTPHMSGGDVSFTTSTSPLLAYLDANPIWGVADELPGTESDPLEKELQSCFIGQDGAWGALRSRLREQKTIESLRGLVAHLDGLRETRKAVITVTMGWRLFRDNEQRMTDRGTSGRIVGLQPAGVGPDGVFGTPDRSRTGGSRQACDVARLEATYADSQRAFQDLIGEANRTGTAFYTMDAAGLRTETRPVTATAAQALAEMRNRERVPYSTRLDSIRTLGESTNGMAIVDSNDFSGGLRRAAADFNSYYLLGYTSSNGKADGKYRKIKVTVKRPGVRVRARDGYLARNANDRPAESPASTSASPAGGPSTASDAQLTAALGRLTPPRPGVPLVVSAAAGAVAGGAKRAIRVTAELDPTVAATPEWAGGGEAMAFVRNLKGDTVTSGKATLAKGTRTVEIEVPVVEGMAGDVKVQVRLTGSGPLARYTDTTSVALDAMPEGWGAPRLSRRGPSTGIAWVPTADPRFRRQERLRVSVGVGGEGGTVTGTLLDRQGKPLNVPVRIEQPGPAALVAELAFAPLAAGDYVLALGGGDKRLLVPVRIVP